MHNQTQNGYKTRRKHRYNTISVLEAFSFLIITPSYLSY